MLRVEDVSVSFGPTKVLASVSFTIHNEEKVALIGNNGAGKTTLLRVIAGEQPGITGSSVRPAGLTQAWRTPVGFPSSKSQRLSGNLFLYASPETTFVSIYMSFCANREANKVLYIMPKVVHFYNWIVLIFRCF